MSAARQNAAVELRGLRGALGRGELGRGSSDPGAAPSIGRVVSQEVVPGLTRDLFGDTSQRSRLGGRDDV